MRMMCIALLVAGVVAVGCGGGDDDEARSTFRVQADAVFCTDLVSARDTVISGLVDADGRVSSAGVVTFASAYEPILREHVVALGALDAPAADANAVAGVIAAATAVADGLHAAVTDPDAVVATDGPGLRALATSPTLVARLSAIGLATC